MQAGWGGGGGGVGEMKGSKESLAEAFHEILQKLTEGSLQLTTLTRLPVHWNVCISMLLTLHFSSYIVQYDSSILGLTK